MKKNQQPYSPDQLEIVSGTYEDKTNAPDETQPPRRPDWLMILVISLFLLTLLIAWFTGIPVIFR